MLKKLLEQTFEKYAVSVTAGLEFQNKDQQDQTSSFTGSNVTQEKSEFLCHLCERTFPTRDRLNFHQRYEHRNQVKTYRCTECGKMYNFLYKLRDHMASAHEKVTKFSCSFCQYTTFYKRSLDVHIESVHERLRVECHVCHQRLSKSSMKLHLRIHTGEKPFKCHKCEKKFISRKTLDSHMDVHKEDRPVLCEVCGKLFKNKENLSRHQIIHEEHKMYSCEFCSKSFRFPHVLKIHLLVHTKEKAFFCPLCQKSFTRQWNLKLHLRIHNNEKPHACTICTKSFANPSNLTTHMRSHAREKR